ncbi:hypothetical protein Q3V94_04575 [Caloramator sp. CAR-1]|uniref:hypothetical protein n=1 Tax=Caloramator sp. CAR-1 TaxID=3062777 RepID=UPI0026E12A80|nr:hypothetical protein [Caloramator sp. CAR-1]MDO6354359.1 hypothetical protein [Caloramator sp. CAR-1]
MQNNSYVYPYNKITTNIIQYLPKIKNYEKSYTYNIRAIIKEPFYLQICYIAKLQQNQ